MNAMMPAAGQLQSRAAALLQPIAADNPGGQNAHYDPRHAALRAEVAKLDTPGGGEVDWVAVVRDATALLSATSKDLFVAATLAFGCLQTEGLPGLATGLTVVTGLLSDFWETTFPPPGRMRGRTNALSWLVTRLEHALPQRTLAPEDRPALDAVLGAYAALATVARERMADAAPGMSPVSEVLQRMDLKIPKGEAGAISPARTAAADAAADGETASAPADDADPPSEPSPHAPPDAPDAEARQQAARWLEPIAGDAITGIDARYEPDYEAMRAEVGKLESARGEEIDWPAVQAHAATILRDKSKDALAASCFAFARMQTDGLGGLATGLAVVVGLFEMFPERRWPKRERGQGNAVGWLAGQLEHALASVTPQPRDRPALLAVDALLNAAGPVLREHLGEHAPSFRPCTEKVTRLLLSVPEPSEAPPPPPAAVSAPPPAATSPPPPAVAPAPMPTPVADVGSLEEVTKYLQETGRALVKAANVLRRASVASPPAYRLLRAGLYLHVDRLPPADAGGKTKVPALPAARNEQLALIANSGNWAALVEESESALMQFRFCLDLHRYTAQALVGLGHTDALAAMQAELNGALQRMLEWPSLLAADGSPLADEATRTWLTQLAGADSNHGASPSGAPAEHDRHGTDPDALATAKKLMADGQGAAALKVAQASVDAATHPRHRFTRRLDLAELCLNAGQHRLARGVFASLDDELVQLGISAWEPTLATRCLQGLVISHRALTQKGAPSDPAAEVAFVRLCRLDPSAAARLAED